MGETRDDWWNRLYDEESGKPTAEDAPEDDEPEKEEVPSGPGWFTPEPGYYPRPHIPDALTHAPERIALSARTRRGLYNASAAGAGWGLGLYRPFAAAIADCSTTYSTSGGLTLGIGGCLLIAHTWDRRTRHWWPGLAWAARIPLATAVLALALWAPASV